MDRRVFPGAETLGPVVSANKDMSPTLRCLGLSALALSRKVLDHVTFNDSRDDGNLMPIAKAVNDIS